jgi:hypothetical protein
MKLTHKFFAIASVVSLGLALPALTFATGLVNLGTAENFAILAKTGVSTTGTTQVNGDIGVSPVAATALTGFGLVADASNKFSTSALVNGKLYAADYAVPASATLIAAISDMEAAYSEAASRPIPTILGRNGGEIGGLTFTPGLYKWNTGVVINSDVILTGGTEDVWIFQIAENLDVASSTKIIFPNGEQVKNIFWQVSGQTTLGGNSAFAGNILGQGVIALKSGATLKGRVLGETAVTLDGNTITEPGFIVSAASMTPPTGTSTPAIPAVPAVPAGMVPASVIPPGGTPSAEALQGQLNILLATLQTLMAQAKSAGIVVPPQTQPSVKLSQYFTKNLFLGSKGSEVSSLQSFLIAKNAGADAGRLAAVGATGNFGLLTKKALMEFQKSAGIVPASGYLGPKTINLINSL